ncbi:hypothetical protein B0H14DRAFT_2583480 [Mycena olivaceomarginata]|nr:hypothetical protein B0H14DRAFT_2583480 [Mycena olivaceomarginata]
MPEKGVILLNARKVGWEEHRMIASGADRNRDELFFAHPDCCARITGECQTFTIHASSPEDQHFVSLPWLPPPPSKANEPPSHYCTSCQRGYDDNDPVAFADYASIYPTASDIPAADFVNSLDITGRISAKARGKELVIAICNSVTRTNVGIRVLFRIVIRGFQFIFHVAFGMEAHCFWMPTAMYNDITAQEPVRRGDKSFVFQFRLNIFQLPPVRSQPLVELQIWPALWSSTHGPVYSLEPIETIEAINAWRSTVLNSPSYRASIFKAMKTSQTAFNGSGAQEANDQLFLAFIHPQMPARLVCESDILFQRLLEVVIEYDKGRNTLALPGRLPYVSSERPLYMNINGHTKYLRTIFSYKRTKVTFNAEQLRKAHELNLFQPEAIIQPDGRAIVPDGVIPVPLSAPIELRNNSRLQKVTKVPYIYICIVKESNLKAYSPFTARAPDDWPQALPDFVDCAWSAQKIAASGGLALGPRRVESAGPANRKRPRASEIAKHKVAKKKPRVSQVEKENIDASEERIMTRSQRRKLGKPV